MVRCSFLFFLTLLCLCLPVQKILADVTESEFLKQYSHQKRPLEVEFFSSDKMTIHFTQPMIFPKDVGSSTQTDVLIQIVPKLEGQFRWVSPQTLIYSLRDPLPPNNSFQVTVKAGVPSLLGFALIKDVSFPFTITAQAESQQPKSFAKSSVSFSIEMAGEYTPVYPHRDLELYVPLPLFLRTDDVMKTQVSLLNHTEQEMSVNIGLDGECFDISPVQTNPVLIPANSTVFIPLQFKVRKEVIQQKLKDTSIVAEQNRVVRASFHLSARSSIASDEVVTSLPVYSDQPETGFSFSGAVWNDVSQEITRPGNATSGEGMLTVQIGTQIKLLIKNMMGQLSRSHDSDLEQRVAKIYPLVLFMDRDSLSSRKVNQFIQLLRGWQSSDGGFGPWPFLEPELALTVMVAEFLGQVREAGFNAEDVILKLREYLLKSSNEIKNNHLQVRILYALHVLGAPGSVGVQNLEPLLVDHKNDLDPVSLAKLMEMICDQDTQSEAVQNWLNNLEQNYKVEGALSSINFAENDFEHSPRVSTARVLQTLLKLKPSHPLVLPFLFFVIQDRGQSFGVVPAELLETLRALKAYLQIFPFSEKSAVVSLVVNDQQAIPLKLTPQETEETIQIPSNKLPEILRLKIKKEVGEILYYHVQYNDVLNNFPKYALDQGISYARNFYTLDGNRVLLDQLKLNTIYRVVLDFFISTDVQQLAIEEPLPAGVTVLKMNKLGQNLFQQRQLRFWVPKVSRGLLELSYQIQTTQPGDFVLPPGRAFDRNHPAVRGESLQNRIKIQ